MPDDLEHVIGEHLGDDAELLWLCFGKRFAEHLDELGSRLADLEVKLEDRDVKREIQDALIERLRKELEVARGGADDPNSAFRLSEELREAKSALESFQQDSVVMSEELAKITSERDELLAAVGQRKVHSRRDVLTLLDLDPDEFELSLDPLEVLDLTSRPTFAAATRSPTKAAGLKVGQWAFLRQEELLERDQPERSFEPALTLEEAVAFGQRAANPKIRAALRYHVDCSPVCILVANGTSFYASIQEAQDAAQRLGSPLSAVTHWSKPISQVEAERWAMEPQLPDPDEPLVEWLRKQKLQVQDFRPGGRLWVYGPSDTFENLKSRLAGRNIRFRWAEKRMGWWTDYEG